MAKPLKKSGEQVRLNATDKGELARAPRLSPPQANDGGSLECLKFCNTIDTVDNKTQNTKYKTPS